MSLPASSESRFERWPGIFGLAFGVLAGPVSALMMQVVAYSGVQWACGHQSVGPVHLVPVIFVALAASALWISWRAWTSVGRIGRAEGPTVSERTRFLALAGMILSAYSIVVILSMWLPLVIFDPCQR